LRTLIVAFALALFASRGVDAQDPSTAKKPSPSKSKTTKHSSATKRTQAARSATSSSATKTPTTSTTAHRRASSKTTKRTQTQTAHRLTQQQPSSDRYKEIQQALADKGYFSGPADGNWGPESVDALKRFQREQNLTEDGKIGSLSLIALGLGPKHTTDPTPEKSVQQR